MLSAFVERITNYFVRNGIVTEDNHEVFHYGAEIILSTFISMFSIVMIGVLFHRLFESALFIAVLIPIKQNTGGYHAKHHYSCILTTVGIYVFSILGFFYLSFLPAIFWMISLFGAFLIILLFAPCENINKPMDDQGKRQAKNKSIVASLILILCVILLCHLGVGYYQYLTLILTIISFNLTLGILERRYHHENID